MCERYNFILILQKSVLMNNFFGLFAKSYQNSCLRMKIVTESKFVEKTLQHVCTTAIISLISDHHYFRQLSNPSTYVKKN